MAFSFRRGKHISTTVKNHPILFLNLLYKCDRGMITGSLPIYFFVSKNPKWSNVILFIILNIVIFIVLNIIRAEEIKNLQQFVVFYLLCSKI